MSRDTADSKGASVSIDVSAIPSEPVGAGRYVIELLKNLPEVSADMRIVLISRQGDTKRWSELVKGCYQVQDLVPKNRAMRLVYERFSLGTQLERRGIKVHHGPHYTLPSTSKISLISTIHDLTFFDFPQYHAKSKVVFFKKAITDACNRADVIICVSQQTKNRLIELFNPKGEVCVIPHGVDTDRFKPNEDFDGQDQKIIDELLPGDDFILYLGTIEGRKRVDVLVRAFDLLIKDKLVHQETNLVLAGKSGWKTEEVETAIKESPNGSRILRLGWVKDRVVPSLLRKSLAVVYPSQVEGFGLPVLEAMACGSKIITTQDTVMAELSKGVAYLCEPGLPESLEEALNSALSDLRNYSGSSNEEVVINTREQMGLDLARKSSWHESAKLHAEIYERLA
ncbi:MAG: glycosyltransferase family 4 protein [Acidimicrobiales bacterium]|nr:glycosyltransferase family 4 protein [Acidimicrobiales bacterium]